MVARACVVACGFVASAILTRKLGPTEYGIYGVVISQLLWLEMLLNTGVSGATAKLMADGRDDQGEVERSARALLVGWAVLLLAISWVVAPQIAESDAYSERRIAVAHRIPGPAIHGDLYLL